jgi:ABC-type glycerol-3-phosphate transport system permease component
MLAKVRVRRERPHRRPLGRRNAAATIGRLLAFGALTIWTLTTVAPVVVALLSSVKGQTELVASPLSWPAEFRFDNYAKAWSGTNLGKPLYTFVLNSLIASTTGIVFALGGGTLAGYAVARDRSEFGSFVNRYFVLLLTVPIVVTWVPLFTLADRLSLTSSPFALGVIYAARLIPFTAVIMRAYFSSFPLDLIDAAKIDGATELKAFRRIVLPLSWGALAAVGLVQIIFLWNELGLAIVLLIKPESRTLPVGLTQFAGQFGTDLGATFAGLMLTIAPILVVYAFLHRRLSEGLRIGSFK